MNILWILQYITQYVQQVIYLNTSICANLKQKRCKSFICTVYMHGWMFLCFDLFEWFLTNSHSTQCSKVPYNEVTLACPSATLASLYISIFNNICTRCSAVEALKDMQRLFASWAHVECLKTLSWNRENERFCRGKGKRWGPNFESKWENAFVSFFIWLN